MPDLMLSSSTRSGGWQSADGKTERALRDRLRRGRIGLRLNLASSGRKDNHAQFDVADNGPRAWLSDAW